MVLDPRPPRDERFMYPKAPACIAWKQEACIDAAIDVERIKEGTPSDGALLVFVALVEQAQRDILAPEFFAATLATQDAPRLKTTIVIQRILEEELDNLRSIATSGKGDFKQADAFCDQIREGISSAWRPGLERLY